MKQSVFGSWNITVIKSEQHLQIELCLETGDRVFTKTLTKNPENTDRRKTLSQFQPDKVFSLA
jgi:hypothetical protein